MKRLFVTIFKRTLDVLIVLYLISIPVIAMTGGFKISVLGISIKATHLYNPLQVLMLLILMRLIITIEFKNFLLVLGSIFFGFLFMEIVVRIWDPPIANPRMTEIHRPSAVFGWELVPGSSGFGRLGEYYQINSAGFRDTEHTIDKKAEIRRIVAIGDSFTFGMGVNLEETYPKQLQRILTGRGINSEVINLGVIGHDMWQYYEVLNRRALAYQPDLVILGLWMGDDASESIAPYDESGRYTGPYPFRSYEEDQGASGVMSYLAIWNFLRHVNIQFEYKYRYRRGHTYLKGIEERKKKYGGGRPANAFYKAVSGNLERRKYSEFSVTLKEFVKTAHAADAKVLVVMIPDSVQLNEPELQFTNKFVAQITRELGVPFIDTTPSLEAEEDHTSLYLFPFDAHNSRRGLRIIAKVIAEKIFELRLLRGA